MVLQLSACTRPSGLPSLHPGFISVSDKSPGLCGLRAFASAVLSAQMIFFLPFTSLMTPHPQLSPKMTLAMSTFLDSQVLLFDIPRVTWVSFEPLLLQ